MIPRAKIENDSKAPPENRLNSPSAPPWAPALSWSIASGSTPGTRIAAPTRYSPTMKNVNRSLLRRSWILKTFLMRLMTDTEFLTNRDRREASGDRFELPVRELVALGGRTTGLALGLERQLDQRDRTPGG